MSVDMMRGLPFMLSAAHSHEASAAVHNFYAHMHGMEGV